MTSAAATLATLRSLLLGVLLFGLVGAGTDLLLIGHDEDAWQLIPLALTALAILACVVMLVTRRAAAGLVRAFRVVMGLLIASGVMGMILHYRANMEFKLEMDPSLGGAALFWSVVQAKAPPALAPATMAFFGLLGLASTFRHDRRSAPDTSSTFEGA